MINKNNFIKQLLLKISISIILFLIFIIGIKKDNNLYNMIHNYIYVNSISFAKFNTWYESHFGNLFIKLNEETIPVYNETFTYEKVDPYKDGYIFTVKEKYLVPFIRDGIVIYKGYKEDYGDVIIVEDDEGNDIWYCNITSNVNIYDYVKKEDYIGEAKDNKLILLFYKDGEKEDYKKYI